MHAIVVLTVIALADPAGAQRGGDGSDGPPGRPGPGSGPGPGGPREDTSLVEAHDANGDGWLDQAERAEARAALLEQRAAAEREGRNPGRRGPRAREREPAV
ncbi:MAG: hypothetical protein ACYTF9_16020, partial [Planctomycetota bacterium]